MRIWITNGLASAALAAGALLGVYAAGPALGSGPVREIAVAAKPVPLSTADAAADRVGRLRFLGALVLESADKRFGGLSDLLWEPRCQRFLSVSDTGNWAILEPEEQGGRLTGLKAAWLAPLLDEKGAPPASKTAADAESLARTADGDIWVFYEQHHRAERYHGVSACEPASLALPAKERRLFPGTEGWPANGGMEATAARGQSFLILAESVPAADGGRQGLEAGEGQAPRLFRWTPPEGHEPTGMDLFEGADGKTHMLVVHRRFSPFTGVSAAISEAVIDEPIASHVAGQEIARLAPPLTVDNMEGIAIRSEGGRRYVYLLSDDNFNRLQRTILMKFELLPE